MAANPVAPLPQMFSASVEARDGVAVVTCSGRLTSDFSEDFRLQVKNLLPNFRHIHLELGDVQYVDSSGLGTLLSAYVSAKLQGCELKLVNPRKRLRDLLKMTHLSSVFDTYDD